MLANMTTCSYCAQPATMTIISLPAQVCVEHALEFWTGLLAFAHDRSGPCVKLERMCTCPLCEQLSGEQARALAIASVGRSPGDHEHFPIRLAS